MPNTTDYEFGDVVLIPFTDQTVSKKRPAVVVNSNAYSRQRPDLILMPITGQVNSPTYFGEVPVSDWRQAGLIKPSVIKPIFTTMEKGLVLRKLGRLCEKDRTALKEALKTLVGDGA
ncbi:MAG: type II toxin-antitoxin system PemK/MazF family toxin [Syntrophobacteraceae bacterium]